MYPENSVLDAVVVGAGFSGLFMLHNLLRKGLKVQLYEKGDDVGGTWYWNRYPGARCDVPSMQYCYSFDDTLQQEWEWSARYATQPEIFKYFRHVADRFDLRKHIKFSTCVTNANYLEESNVWVLKTDKGDTVACKYTIMATGCLSSSWVPDINGLSDFKGKWYHTGRWPHDEVDFRGKKVAVIGTGSSGIQSIPRIAEEASKLFVFQRTPAFSIPANQAMLSPEEVADTKKKYNELRAHARDSSLGAFAYLACTLPAISVSPEEREKIYESSWKLGGLEFICSFPDLLQNPQSNATAVDFIHGKVKAIVNNPETADLLCPKDYPFAAKRMCVDTNYFDTYNRDNVSLVDISSVPISNITETGIKVGDKEYEVDIIVFATGYDAVTGALNAIDIQGLGAAKLKEKWAAGPHAYLGLMSAGIPNLFMITGPGSPSVVAFMNVSIEQHVNWVADCIAYMQNNNFARIDVEEKAQDEWVAHVNVVASMTLYSKANSWYKGTNIPGKPRVLLPYFGGVAAYSKKCADVVAAGYEGFILSH